VIGIDGFHLGRPSTAQLDAALRSARAAEPTYDHVGSTLDPAGWPGGERQTAALEIGRGTAAFDRAGDGLRRWVCHRGIGARIHPSDPPLEVGTTLLVVLPAGPCSIAVPNRIVVVVDEPRRFGFAYATLAGHHERGEELFLVEHHDDDTVQATLRVDAVISSRPARLVAPAVRTFQRHALHRYLDAWRAHVHARPDPGGRP
jgi:uncharacterized protein (UPF0548 family)